MAYRDSYGGGFGASVTPWVKRLLIANTAVFVVLMILGLIPATRGVSQYLFFAPRNFLTRPWTLFTYAFVHLQVMHLLGNLLTLFFFGSPLEERWGSRGFLRVYAIAAAGGAILSTLLWALSPAAFIIGASGATLGLMTAFAMYWPDVQIFVFGIFPVKAKWLVLGTAFINLSFALDGSGGNGVAVLAHLGGMAATFLLLKSPWAPPAWGEVPIRRSRKKKAGVLAGWSALSRKGSEPASRSETPTPVRSNAAERQLLDDVDRILDKISAEGLSSLTPEERSRLDEVSKRYRTN
jgi:membrane associated rhomboid family serine protease